MKDYFDIWFLSKHFEFDGKILVKAIKTTFENRKVAMDLAPVALSSVFSADAEKQKQWIGFIRKLHLENTPDLLEVIIRDLNDFLGPLMGALADNGPLPGKWSTDGGWNKS